MKQAAAHTTTGTDGVRSLTAGVIASTFLDTTWRIAVPVVIFTGIGIFADKSLGSKPWLTLLAVVIGFVVAGYLVKEQLKAAEKMERKK